MQLYVKDGQTCGFRLDNVTSSHLTGTVYYAIFPLEQFMTRKLFNVGQVFQEHCNVGEQGWEQH